MPGLSTYVASAGGGSSAPPDQSQAQSGAGGESPFVPIPYSAQDMAAQALHLQTAGSSTQLPANMQPKVRQYHPSPDRPYTQAVGKGNMRGQGIGKAISGLANIVGAVATAKANNKEMEQASQVSTLLQNQHAIEEAQQTLQNDPNNQQAKDLIQHNQTINQNLLKDDKLRKHIQEGMKIDFTDPKANQTESHNIFSKGKAMAEKMIGMKGQQAPPTTDAQAAGYAKQFAAGTPQQMQPNQQAIARLNMMQEANKNAMEVNKAMVPLVRQQMIEQGKVSAEDKKNALEASKAMLDSQTKLDIAATNAKSRQAVANTEANSRLADVYAKGQVDLDVFKKEMTASNNDPGKQMVAYQKLNLDYGKQITSTGEAIGKLEADKNKAVAAAPKATKTQVSQSYDDQINSLKEAKGTLEDTLKGQRGYYQQLLGIPEEGSKDGTGQPQPQPTSSNTAPGKSLGTKAAEWTSDAAHSIFQSGENTALALKGGNIANLFKNPDDLKQ